jgi:uncharacterized spore protein YtfJ
MSLNRLFDTVEQARNTAHWQAAFGEPQVVEDKTIIPVASVGYGFGLGFGIAATGTEGEETGVAQDEAVPPGEAQPVGEGGGVGGGAAAKPLGAIVVTPERVYFEETMDTGKVAMAGVLLSAWIVFMLAKVLRPIFARG